MATHTFDLGDRVTVFNRTIDGKFIIEGMATIKGYSSDVDEQYFVRFDSKSEYHRERGLYGRFVDPAGQDDPQAFVQMLNGEVR